MAAFRKNRLRLAGASSPSLVWRLCFLVRWNFCQREPRCVRWLYPLTVPFQAFAKAKPTTTQSQRRLTAHTIGLQQCCRASWSRRHGGQTKERAGGRVGSGDGRRDVAGGTEQTTQKGGGGGGGGGSRQAYEAGPVFSAAAAARSRLISSRSSFVKAACGEVCGSRCGVSVRCEVLCVADGLRGEGRGGGEAGGWSSPRRERATPGRCSRAPRPCAAPPAARRWRSRSREAPVRPAGRAAAVSPPRRTA